MIRVLNTVMIKTMFAAAAVLVVLLLVLSVQISQPIAARSNNTCPHDLQSDSKDDCVCPDGSQPHSNDDCPNEESSPAGSDSS
jgi:hypothetical protein